MIYKHKQILFSVALVLAFLSTTATANFTQTIAINTAETYDVSLFGQGSADLTLSAQASVIVTADSNTSIAVDQEGTLTFTLTGAVFAEAVVVSTNLTNTTDLSFSDDGTGQATQISNARVLSGGTTGSNTVTIGMIVANAAIDTDDTFILNFSGVTLRNASGLGTAGNTITISAAFDGIGSNASALSGFNNRTVTGTNNVIATSASRLSTALVAAAANEADIQLADRTNFENTTATDSETSAELGTVQATMSGLTPAAADGATPAAFAAADQVTVTGNFGSASAVCLSTDNDCSDTADFMGTINAATNQATIIATNADTINNTLHNILLVTNTTSPIPSSAYTATADINYATATSQDVTGTPIALNSTTLAGLTAAGERALAVTRPGGSDLTFVRITNTGNATAQLFAQLTSEAGVVSNLIELTALPALATRVMSSEDFNTYFNTSELSGRSNVQFMSSGSVIVTNLLRSGDILSHIDG